MKTQRHNPGGHAGSHESVFFAMDRAPRAHQSVLFAALVAMHCHESVFLAILRDPFVIKKIIILYNLLLSKHDVDMCA